MQTNQTPTEGNHSANQETEAALDGATCSSSVSETPETDALRFPCRYSVATDGIENTVYDHEGNCDLFPTKSGNRDYQCRKCNEDTAKEIALAMNIYDLTMRENHLYEIGNVRTSEAMPPASFRALRISDERKARAPLPAGAEVAYRVKG